MEKIQLFSIFDKVGKRFDTIMLYPNKAIAMRDIVNKITDNPKTSIARFPKDFKLVKIGTYDLISGHIESNLEEVTEIADLYQQPEEIKVVTNEKN